MFGWIINRLRKELTPLVTAEVRAQMEVEMRAEAAHGDRLAQEVRAWLLEGVADVPEVLTERLAAQIDDLVASRIGHLETDLVARLTPKVTQQLEEELRPAQEARLAAGSESLAQAAREKCLLQYLVHNSGAEAGAFYESLPLRIRAEFRAAAREYLKPAVLDELRIELQGTVRSEVTPAVLEAVRSRLLNSAELKQEVRDALKRELRPSVREELRDELAPAVEARLATELRMPVLLDPSGNMEGTVAGVLRRHFAESMEEIRQGVYDETWKTVATAIVEAFGAATRLDAAARETAMDVAICTYGAKGEETQRKVQAAVEAALNVLGADASLFEDSWAQYCSLAKELIDDRLYPSAPKHRPNLQSPDGFYRAVETHACVRTGDAILPGDYYLVLKGCAIAVPVRRADAEDLVERTRQGTLEEPPGAIPPPWPGLPFKEPDAPSTEFPADPIS